MFDPENATGIMPGEGRKGAASDRIMREDGKPVASAVKASELDQPAAVAMHSNLLGHYLREMETQAPNRVEQARDEDFYDNDPYTAAEKAVLAARGQLATSFNVISTTLNWVIGTERRGRTDYKILPRRKEGSQQAERKSQLLKYLSDANRSQFAVSKAFQSSVKAGVGWLEAGWQYADDGEPVYDRAESWRNMLWDSRAQEDDISDARYIFRTKWMDVDIAAGNFPAREALIERSASNIYDFGGLISSFGDAAMDDGEEASEGGLFSVSTPEAYGAFRNRVRMIEAWFRKPALTRVVSGGDFSGEIFDEFSEGHLREIDSGRAQLTERIKMRTYVAILTTTGLVHLQLSPYRHNRYPFTPVWCYRRGRDGMPYGMIRPIRDLQTHINKAAMKAQYILSTNKTIMEKGAVDDLDQFEEEVARPDAIIVVNAGKRLEMNVDRELSNAHLDLMSRMIAMVQQQSGVTDESLGRTTNATSGKAIIARQDQGSLATAAIFDNLKQAMQIHGEKMLSLVEQFFTEAKSFRITNSRGTPTFVEVNSGLPEDDITLTKADYIISEDDWSATQRQAQVESLMNLVREVAPGAPQILMLILDLLIDMMDIPAKDEVVRRIRQATGMKDPDADPNAPPTPEEVAQAQAKEAEAAMAQRGAEAQIAQAEATAAERQARADKTNIEAKKLIASMAGLNIETQQAAFAAAMQMLSAPQIAEVADAVLVGAGYSALAAQQAAKADAEGAQAQEQQKAMEAAQAQAEMAQAAQSAGIPVAEGAAPPAPTPAQNMGGM